MMKFNKGLFDIVAQGSSIPLGELNARMIGDSETLASDLATLVQEGLVVVNSDQPVSLTPNTADFAGKVIEILKSPQANSYFAQPTARGFKSMG